MIRRLPGEDMNEATNMDERSQSADNATQPIHGAGNGHARRIPEWGDVEFVPLPSRPPTLWRRLMSTRPVRAIADYAQAERRPVPAWVPTTIAMLGVLLVTNFGVFMYWKGQTDLLLSQHGESLKQVRELTDQNREMKVRIETMDSLEEWVGLLVVYEQGLREKLGPVTQRYNIELPPMPARPPRKR